MCGSMVIDTPAMGSVTKSSICLNCPLCIFDRDFGIDLVCLPLVQVDVILGMNCLKFNHVHINYYAKMVMFLEFVGGEDLFVSAKQVNQFVKEVALVLMMLASFDVNGKGVTGNLPIVCNFPDVFPD